MAALFVLGQGNNLKKDTKMILKSPFSPLLILSLSAICNPLFANDISFQGATGTLSTPNAYTAKEGQLSYQYNSYGEQAAKNRFDNTYNHIFTLGLHPRLEIGGRLTDYFNQRDEFNTNGTRQGKRDLSANLKFSLPQLGYGLPDVAIGAMDIAGEALNFQSQYVVASKKLGKGTYSIGYAQGDNSDFSGTFGSAQYDISANLSLLGEYTSTQYNLGMNYDFGRLFGVPVALSAAIPVDTQAGESDDPIFGLSFSVPVSQLAKREKAITTKSASFSKTNTDYHAYTQKLAHYGLEDIRLGKTKAGNIIVAYDNRTYNHSYLDAAGIVAGTAIELLDTASSITLVILDNQTPKLAVKLPLADLKHYYTQNTPATKQTLTRKLKAWYPPASYLSTPNIQWIKGTHIKNRTRADVVLQPNIKTAIGTEWGTGDYSLAARTDLDVALWKGGSLHLTADAPISNTALFSENHAFAASKHQSGITQALVQQTLKPSAKSVAMASIGQMNIQQQDYYTVQSEAVLASKSGNTKLYAKAARFEATDDTNDDAKNTYLASLQQSFPHYQASGKVAYGKYFEGDKGTRLELTRHIGDTDITAYVNYIDKQDIAGGLQLSLPLTPRRDYKKGALVVRGNEHWSYSQGTTIKDPVVVGSNRIRTDMMLNPSPSKNLDKDYFESNRLSPAYLRANISRLREAYLSLRQ